MAKFVENKDFDILTPIQQQLLAIGFLIEGDAKRNCPVDTGRLRASISTNWSDSGKGEGIIESKSKKGDGIKNPGKEPNKFIVVVGSNVEYCPYMELGTKYIAPRAMLRRAFEKHASKLNKIGK
jgi:hypothetical protein